MITSAALLIGGSKLPVGMVVCHKHINPLSTYPGSSRQH